MDARSIANREIAPNIRANPEVQVAYHATRGLESFSWILGGDAAGNGVTLRPRTPLSLGTALFREVKIKIDLTGGLLVDAVEQADIMDPM